MPGKSYGPFVFGADVSSVPHLAKRLDSDDMGDGDVSSRWATQLDGVEVDFWNDVLIGVTSSSSFVFDNTELIGARYVDVRDVLPAGPRLQNLDPVVTAQWEDFNLMLFMTTELVITDVSVDVDPDLFQSS